MAGAPVRLRGNSETELISFVSARYVNAHIPRFVYLSYPIGYETFPIGVWHVDSYPLGYEIS